MRFNWNFDYIKGSKIAYTFSIILTVVGIISLLSLGLNYAVDFRSGSNVDITVSKAVTTEQINPIVNELGVDTKEVRLQLDLIGLIFDSRTYWMKTKKANSSKNLANWMRLLLMK